MIKNLLKNATIGLAVAGTSGGSTSVNTAVFDMQGYEGILFVAFNGVAGSSDWGIWAEMGTSSGLSSTSSTIAGSKVNSTSAGTDIAMVLDIYRPQHRYVKANVDQQSSGDIGGVIAIQYGARKFPISQSTGTGFAIINSEISVSASSGTV